MPQNRLTRGGFRAYHDGVRGPYADINWRSEVEAADQDTYNRLLAARKPLIKTHHVPLEWIQGLGPTDLDRLLEGIKAAEAAGEDWRDWIESYTAREVLMEVIPTLKSGGTTVAQA